MGAANWGGGIAMEGVNWHHGWPEDGEELLKSFLRQSGDRARYEGMGKGRKTARKGLTVARQASVGGSPSRCRCPADLA